MTEARHDEIERVEYRRDPELEDIEVLHVNLQDLAFERHLHETFATSVIDRGSGSFWYRGETRHAPAGSVVLLNPGEPHTGNVTSDAGWRYRILYPKVSLLERIASEAFGGSFDCHFPDPVIRDPDIAFHIGSLHRTLSSESPVLDRESELVSVYTTVLTRCARPRPPERQVGKEPGAVRNVREYLEESYVRGPSLTELSEVARLSRFYLIRTFSRSTGMPPHAYLTQIRLRRARHLISNGVPIGEAAARVGFVDQSHLTRRFKRSFGITPGQFARESTR